MDFSSLCAAGSASLWQRTPTMHRRGSREEDRVGYEEGREGHEPEPRGTQAGAEEARGPRPK